VQGLFCGAHIADHLTSGLLDIRGWYISSCVGHFVTLTGVGVVGVNSLATSESPVEETTRTPMVDKSYDFCRHALPELPETVFASPRILAKKRQLQAGHLVGFFICRAVATEITRYRALSGKRSNDKGLLA
jgi:hypothetical protein